MSFYLHGSADEKLRLKSFSAVSRGNSSTIKIELVTADPYELAYALKCLTKVQEGQKPPKPASMRKAKPKPLYLPAPRPALPGPEDEA